MVTGTTGEVHPLRHRSTKNWATRKVMGALDHEALTSFLMILARNPHVSGEIVHSAGPASAAGEALVAVRLAMLSCSGGAR